MKSRKLRSKNTLIALLILIIILLSVYIILMGVNRNRVEPTDEQTIVDSVKIDSVVETFLPNNEVNSHVEVKTLNTPIKNESDNADNTNINIVKSEEVNIERQGNLENKDDSNVKFGLTYSKRNEIWVLYSNEQNEIQQKALDVNEDRFSRAYLSYIDSQTKISNFAIQKHYDIEKFTLQNIIKEGKDGKFEKALKSHD